MEALARLHMVRAICDGLTTIASELASRLACKGCFHTGTGPFACHHDASLAVPATDRNQRASNLGSNGINSFDYTPPGEALTMHSPQVQKMADMFRLMWLIDGTAVHV